MHDKTVDELKTTLDSIYYRIEREAEVRDDGFEKYESPVPPAMVEAAKKWIYQFGCACWQCELPLLIPEMNRNGDGIELTWESAAPEHCLNRYVILIDANPVGVCDSGHVLHGPCDWFDPADLITATTHYQGFLAARKA